MNVGEISTCRLRGDNLKQIVDERMDNDGWRTSDDHKLIKRSKFHHSKSVSLVSTNWLILG